MMADADDRLAGRRRRRRRTRRGLPGRDELFYAPETLLLDSLARALRTTRAAIRAQPGAGFAEEHDDVRRHVAAVTIRYIDGLLACIRMYREAVVEQIRLIARDMMRCGHDEIPF